jgi:DNA repair protein RAD50
MVSMQQATEELKAVKFQLRELRALQSGASIVTRTYREVEKLGREIKDLELTLMPSGITDTADDIQAQLDAIDGKLQVLNVFIPMSS